MAVLFPVSITVLAKNNVLGTVLCFHWEWIWLLSWVLLKDQGILCHRLLAKHKKNRRVFLFAIILLEPICGDDSWIIPTTRIELNQFMWHQHRNQTSMKKAKGATFQRNHGIWHHWPKCWASNHRMMRGRENRSERRTVAWVVMLKMANYDGSQQQKSRLTRSANDCYLEAPRKKASSYDFMPQWSTA